MNGPQHYRKAEDLMNQALVTSTTHGSTMAIVAVTHAILALVDAVVNTDVETDAAWEELLRK